MGKDRVQRLIQVINKIPLFANLGPSQVQAVLSACSPKRFEEGDVLCEAGGVGEELFILLTGSAGVIAADGTDVYEIKPIATIGEMSIATKMVRSSTIKAKEVCNVLEIKRLSLDVALKADADAQAKILRNVVEILAERMENESTRRQEERVAQVEQQEQIRQLQQRADTALAILSRKAGMPMDEATKLLEEELGADDTERRVLVVDDEDHIRTMLTKVLGNYDVIAVGSGSEAIETAMESKPDLVITDIRMPDMDGYALLSQLREFHPNVPVLALSGVATDEDVREYDFDGFIAKPMDMEQFKRVVASALVGASSS